MKRLLLLTISLSIGMIAFAGPVKSIYSIASGDFRSGANIWSLSPGGPLCGCFPD